MWHVFLWSRLLQNKDCGEQGLSKYCQARSRVAINSRRYFELRNRIWLMCRSFVSFQCSAQIRLDLVVLYPYFAASIFLYVGLRQQNVLMSFCCVDLEALLTVKVLFSHTVLNLKRDFAESFKVVRGHQCAAGVSHFATRLFQKRFKLASQYEACLLAQPNNMKCSHLKVPIVVAMNAAIDCT